MSPGFFCGACQMGMESFKNTEPMEVPMDRVPVESELTGVKTWTVVDTFQVRESQHGFFIVVHVGTGAEVFGGVGWSTLRKALNAVDFFLNGLLWRDFITFRDSRSREALVNKIRVPYFAKLVADVKSGADVVYSDLAPGEPDGVDV